MTRWRGSSARTRAAASAAEASSAALVQSEAGARGAEADASEARELARRLRDRLADFQICEVLGKGSFGTVRLVQHKYEDGPEPEHRPSLSEHLRSASTALP